MIRGRTIIGRIIALAVIALVVMAATASLASATTPSQKQYPNGGGVAGQQQQNGPPSTPSSLGTTAPSGNLPFTGLSLAVVVAGSLVLLGGGFALRRSGRRQGEQQ